MIGDAEDEPGRSGAAKQPVGGVGARELLEWGNRVAKWQVLAGQGRASFSRVATVRKRSFETRVDLNTPATVFAVRALDSRGRVIGRSARVPAS